MSMNTTTFETIDSLSGNRVAAKKGFLARLIEARTRRGERQVGYQMSRMSDERLAGMGFTAEQIAQIRLNGRFPASFWR